ncbi:RNA polymerase sigma factor [uncultured Desulfobacter sp.]|uniref:RNA polymerase sigma factor n=1 Tax=uncultured Desulfobacter sp. TaxID=240139 RepID=UPI002AAB3056|nr:RNA polymerase sigma factor [uncultured Desulfobacter sp.]
MENALEQVVIEQVKNGDHKRFRLLVDSYSRPLMVFVSNMMGNGFDAEDMVQETFLSAYRHIRSYSPGKGAFSTWLFTIARNNCINELKKINRAPTVELTNFQGHAGTKPDIEEKEFFCLLDRALGLLPVDEKTIFILAEIQELSYDEIRQITGIKTGTIKSKLSRTKAKLKKLLEDTIGENNEK